MIVFSLWPRKLGFPFFYRNVFHPLFFSTFVPTTTLAPSAVSPIKGTNSIPPQCNHSRVTMATIANVFTFECICLSCSNVTARGGHIRTLNHRHKGISIYLHNPIQLRHLLRNYQWLIEIACGNYTCSLW